jgi:hypothetical protein
MAKEIVQADLARIRALLDEVLGHSDYSDVQRMGGLTNRTYCVTFADGSRIIDPVQFIQTLQTERGA